MANQRPSVMEDQAWKNLQTLLRTRVNAGLAGEVSTSSVREILDSEMAAEVPVTLSVEESLRCLAAQDKPFAPNAKLKKAIRRGLSRR